MSWNSSLTCWEKEDILSREIMIYRKLLEYDNLRNFYLITYDRCDNNIIKILLKESPVYKKIKLVSPPFFISKFSLLKFLWAFTLPLFFKKNIQVYLTHQIDGSIPILLGNIFKNNNNIIRSGYIPSKHRLLYKSKFSLSVILFQLLEIITFRISNYIFLTSACDKKFIISQYKISSEKIIKINNFVDIDLFKRNKLKKTFPDRLLYVGRLSKEKNLLNLVKSISNTIYSLDIVGSGPYKSLIQREALKNNVEVNFLGKFKNELLPDIYSKYKYFILPSLSEGSPKVLLEAMSIGLVCITTPVDGILDIIKNEKNGIICKGFRAEEISNGIKISEKINYELISLNARKYIIENHDYLSISNQYINIVSRFL